MNRILTGTYGITLKFKHIKLPTFKFKKIYLKASHIKYITILEIWTNQETIKDQKL